MNDNVSLYRRLSGPISSECFREAQNFRRAWAGEIIGLIFTGAAFCYLAYAAEISDFDPSQKLIWVLRFLAWAFSIETILSVARSLISDIINGVSARTLLARQGFNLVISGRFFAASIRSLLTTLTLAIIGVLYFGVDFTLSPHGLAIVVLFAAQCLAITYVVGAIVLAVRSYRAALMLVSALVGITLFVPWKDFHWLVCYFVPAGGLISSMSGVAKVELAAVFLATVTHMIFCVFLLSMSLRTLRRNGRLLYRGS